jgi:DNA-binding MarR family transcriptional regulator
MQPVSLQPKGRRQAAARDRVAERLHAAAIHLLRRLRRQDGAMGLTPARASALSIMVFGGRVTIGQLAQAEQVSAPTMTRLVVGMERDGLVRRDNDPNDGRVVWLEATARGRRILHAGRERRVAALAEDLARLGESDRETLAAAVAILERLVGRTEETAGDARNQAGPPKRRSAAARPPAKRSPRG